MACRYDTVSSDLVLTIRNRGSLACRLKASNAYGKSRVARELGPGERFRSRWSLESSFGWYDITVTASTDEDFAVRLAGHLENGKDSASDPALGGPGGPAHTHAHTDALVAR